MNRPDAQTSLNTLMTDLQQAEAEDQDIECGNLHRKIGQLFARQGKYPSAIDHLKLALSYFESAMASSTQVDLRLDVGITCHQLAVLCRISSGTEEGLFYGEQAHMMGMAMEKPAFTQKCAQTLGLLYKRKKSYQKSLQHFEQALALAKQQADPEQIGYVHIQLGKLYHETGQQEKAKEQLETAYKTYFDIDSPRLGLAVQALKDLGYGVVEGVSNSQ